MLNFIAIDLQLYKIFKIMRVSFFEGHIEGCDPRPDWTSRGHDGLL